MENNLLNIDDIIKIAVKEGVKSYKKEIEKENRRCDTTNIIRKFLESYRRTKAMLKNDFKFSHEQKIEIRWSFLEDLMGIKNCISKTENFIDLIELKRCKNQYIVDSLDKALELYKEECIKSNDDEAYRRYREIYALYISDNIKTINDIAIDENISKKTVYKDINIVCNILKMYLIGE